MTNRPIPHHEYVDLPRGLTYGLPDHDSLEERIARAEHDAGMPVGKPGRQSHCWLCRRHYENDKNMNWKFKVLGLFYGGDYD